MEYLLRTASSERIRATIEAPDTVLHTVALCGVVIASALRRAVLAGKVGEDRAREALEDYRDLPITRHEHEPYLRRILDLRTNFSAYDAAYATLGETLEAELLTADAPFARALRTHREVRTLPENTDTSRQS